MIPLPCKAFARFRRQAEACGRRAALNAQTGTVRWDVTVADYHEGNSITGAPLVVKDKVIVGISGWDFGHSGVARRLRRPDGPESMAALPRRGDGPGSLAFSDRGLGRVEPDLLRGGRQATG